MSEVRSNGHAKFGKADSYSVEIPILHGNSSSEDEGPMPPPKDTISRSLTSPVDAETYFNSLRSSRTNSVYSLSRISFSSQLSRLTALHLPEPKSLSISISALPTAPAAAKTLLIAAEQIRKWLQKASEVLTGLDAEDDVEWAAAGGREGLGEVDAAIGRFEGLIAPYVTAIEDLQERADIAKVPAMEQNVLVGQVEQILKEWEDVRQLLKGVKSQVELAMEWEELWNHVLGDIGLEVENLGKLIFEMEESRHKAMFAGSQADATTSIDVQELETIVEEAPTINGNAANHRFSLPHAFSAMSPTSPAFTTPQEDSSLLALFARMQPLRASLDFLPMTLSSFRTRAVASLPSACQELDNRRKDLEKKWKILENDAEGLRTELGEDRWVLVFRNAGRQAQKLCESVERSISKLQESIDAGAQHSNPPALAKKIESYEAKKVHYGPAIERVLGIIEKGVKDRLTVHGEILRLQQDTRARWKSIEAEMKDMDLALDDLSMSKSQQLRDSISTIVSVDRSTAGSVVDTPGSSPASSPVLGPSGNNKGDSLIGMNGLSRRSSVVSNSMSRPNGSRRYASMPHGASSPNQPPRKTPVSRSLSSGPRNSSPSPYAHQFTTHTSGVRQLRPNLAQSDNRPRWNSSPRVDHLEYSPIPRPSPLSAPPPNRKSPMTFRSPSAPGPIPRHLPLRSPLGRSTTSSPAPPALPTYTPPTRHSSGSQTSLGMRQASYSSPLQPVNASPRSTSKTQTQNTNLPSSSSARRQSMQLPSEDVAEESSPSVRPRPPRPSTAMAGRRNSMLPLPKSVIESGRESSLGSRILSNGRESSLGASKMNGGVRVSSGRESSLGGERRWR